MANRYQEECNQAIEEIISHLPNKGAGELASFARRFYQGLSLSDMKEMDSQIACQIAMQVYQDFRVLEKGKPKISISEPEFLKEHHGRSRLAITVINNDMPFLVDSLSMSLKHNGFTIYRTVHPQLQVSRNEKGELVEQSNMEGHAQSYTESLIYFELSPMPQGMDVAKLTEKLQLTLKFVYHAVEDWRIMMAKAREVNTHIVTASHVVNREEVEEASDFMDWLLKNNFIFLGFVEYDFYDSEGKECFTPVKGSELGIFRVEESELLQRGLSTLPPEVRHFALQKEPIEITKSNRTSLVHRDVLMDYIGIKRFNRDGQVIGESRFLGLFTSPVYYQETEAIPYIRRKVHRVMESAGYDPAGHSGKALKAALEFFPRDELFQIAYEDLLEITLGIVSLEERPDIRVFFRTDRFERFVSCFVYMPKDKFNTFVRQEIAKLLERHLDGSISAFYSQITESALARVNYIIRTTPGHIPELPLDQINKELRFVINYWTDALREALQDSLGESEGERLYRQFGEAFPRNYINATPIATAIEDISYLQAVLKENTPAFNLFISEKTRTWHLKMYAFAENIPLSDILPMIENLGFKVKDVVPHRIKPSLEQDGVKLLIRDFSLIPQSSEDKNIIIIKPLVERILSDVWQKKVENDALGALVTLASLDVRQITLLRAYARYAKQAGLSYSDAYVIQALCKHATIAAMLASFFDARFNPAHKKEKQAKVASDHYQHILEALTQVENLAEDKILRFFADTMQATLRTNYYQKNELGEPKPYISFKFDSQAVPNLPLPRPYREIFVYSMTTEGIHLRSGSVARGGLRWSDRHEDFRTEVLGLMKAQVVKNTVIVPTGSKGGFVVKAEFDASDREARQEAGIASYRQFLSGLLDITDNRNPSGVVPPKDVVRYDEDDPYLVVAADKGTATFSDIANSVAQSYGFWLDDAFASGGSAGYDHKKMGITARGAWVSVERHFMEMGKDIRHEDFTVIGIGDMSGDVFGNGMLLSPNIRLLGAFNHLHIFLDPTPDAKTSYEERKKLFELGRGSWDAYNRELISKGGGVFLRSSKTIILTPEIRAMLGTSEQSLAPNDLIKLMLKAPVDLLWNGGIGTYVKARSESHESVGDPGNNGLRVNGEELRARIVAEGGNLGFTQLGRIEYARAGGRLNTDAIDNSAGVDCSDHEVNIKIALHEAVAHHGMTLSARNQLLAQMTDEVAELVLDDNCQQNQALSIAAKRAPEMIELHSRFIQLLEHEKLLDRTVEFLPSRKEMNNLKADGMGLSRPELAILLSYSKIFLYRTLSESKLVDSTLFTPALLSYFPQPMQEQVRDQLLQHPLRREIVATSLTNEIVNRAGITYIFSILNDTGHEICNIVRAYVVVRDLFGLKTLWEQIEALKHKVSSDTQLTLFSETTRFLERMSIWFLNNLAQPLEMEATLATFGKSIREYLSHHDSLLSRSVSDARRMKRESLIAAQVPQQVAEQIANLDTLLSACDIALIDQKHPQSLSVVGKIYYELGARMELGWMRLHLSQFPRENHWDRLAVRNATNQLYEQQRRLTESVLETIQDGENTQAMIERWAEANKGDIERFQRLVYDIKSSEQHNMSMMMVALGKLSAMRPVQAS